MAGWIAIAVLYGLVVAALCTDRPLSFAMFEAIAYVAIIIPTGLLIMVAALRLAAAL